MRSVLGGSGLRLRVGGFLVIVLVVESELRGRKLRIRVGSIGGVFGVIVGGCFGCGWGVLVVFFMSIMRVGRRRKGD